MSDVIAREHRSYNTASIVTGFARQGIPITVIARALAVYETQIESICRRAVATGELIVMPPASPAFTRDALQLEVATLRNLYEEMRLLLNESRNEKENEFTQFLRGVPYFTVQEAKYIAVLVKGGRQSKTHIYFEMYGDRNDAPEPKIVDVLICKIRAKLKPHGVEIVTLWGHGYEMSRENRDKLRALFDLPVVASPSLDMAAA